ncbi:E3 ubiquitin-protein ligase ATL4-like isoform X3 [Ananas comosus]|uniref:E3 ubiquitin-protein ligase ATL4-like isoform X3 n=1 Tax=Ananas comosus TaxID=4615 RepID=A0A6P5EPA3_ANACO|nr:E3 ubiquitin-protein ligase ATL4-like isoform X3 [Ananas comosus]
MAYSPPPPPPPPPLPQTLPPPLQTTTLAAASSASAPSSLTLSPSVLIILAILAIVFLASVAIHLFLRFLSRSPASFLRRGSRNHHHHRAAAAASAGGGEAKEVSEGEKATLIERLPLFTLASALSALPKSSPDCAVCQEPFRPDDELRLLPACRHAFHSRCVDPWLRSTLLCPLCRSSIALPFPPLILPPLPPTTAAATAAAAAAAPRMIDDDDDDDAAPRSGSFRIEMGTVSRRRTAPEDVPGAPSPSPSPHTMRSYAMESYDYVVEEEVEAVISAIPPRHGVGVVLLQLRPPLRPLELALEQPLRRRRRVAGGVVVGFGREPAGAGGRRRRRRRRPLRLLPLDYWRVAAALLPNLPSRSLSIRIIKPASQPASRAGKCGTTFFVMMMEQLRRG